jgi:medium-chain acyl-[acyl-carrier-protein] hydrolase
VLEKAIQCGDAQVVAIDAKWSSLARSLPGLAGSPYLEHLTSERWVSNGNAIAEQARTRLDGAVTEDRLPLAIAELRTIVADALRVSTAEVDPELSLTESGIDSLLAIELKNRLFQTFGASLEPLAILRAPSLRSIAEDLLREMGLARSNEMTAVVARQRRSSPWCVRTPGREDAAVRLFCAPFAGGGAHIFREWSRLIPENIELIALELPGRGRRQPESPHRSLDPLINRLAEELVPLLDRPFAFFGHCMGALVMFELTRHLRRTRGLSPIHLFASACPPPDDYVVPSLDPGTRRYVREHESDRRRVIPIHALPDPELLEVLRFLSFGPGGALIIEPELLFGALPVLRADFEVCSTYRFAVEQPLDIPLTALVGDEDSFAGVAEGNDWRRMTHAPFEMHVHPGDHYFLFPRTPSILAHITRTLEQSAVFNAPGTFRSGVPPAQTSDPTTSIDANLKKDAGAS